jgi:hypothetical protein
MWPTINHCGQQSTDVAVKTAIVEKLASKYGAFHSAAIHGYLPLLSLTGTRAIVDGGEDHHQGQRTIVDDK